MTTRAEKQHLAAVASLGCVVCRQENPHVRAFAEVHHLRSGAGAGQRSSHFRTIPLCPDHHRTGGYGVAFHAGPEIWQEIHGSEEALLLETLDLLEGQG